MKMASIEFNKEKSGFVKQDGKWLKPLKFLGLTYDGERDVLHASTRGGATLEFDKHDLVAAVAYRNKSGTSGQDYGDTPSDIKRRS